MQGQTGCSCVKECAGQCGPLLTNDRNENEQALGSSVFCQGHKSS